MAVPQQSRHNLSHSFVVNPTITFTTQESGEDVLLVVRKHPLTQLFWIVNTFLFTLIVILINLFIPQFLDANHIIVFNFFAVSFIVSYVWVNFLLWYFTVGVVTKIRIVDLDFYNLLYKEFSATTIAQVSDITTKVGGFFGSVFNFGDVFVKTEGFEQNIMFDDIPQPEDVVKIINELMPKRAHGGI